MYLNYVHLVIYKLINDELYIYNIILVLKIGILFKIERLVIPRSQEGAEGKEKGKKKK